MSNLVHEYQVEMGEQQAIKNPYLTVVKVEDYEKID
jgi:hypothetical protein